MKILFVLEHYHPYIGGAEKLFRTIAEAMAKDGHQVEVVTSHFRKDLPFKEVVNKVYVKRLHISNRFLFTFLSFGAVIRAARKCDIIHTTSYNAALPALIAGKLCRKKVIITFHEVLGRLWFKVPFLSFPSRVLNYLYEKFILSLPFNSFVAVSDYTQKQLQQRKIKKSKVYRIYNGIDYNDFQKDTTSGDNKFVYTYFGRVGVTKGINILLDVAREFNEKHSNVHLKLIVPKSQSSFYRDFLNLIRKYNLQQDCTILHNLSDEELQQELTSSSCVVIPSMSEGFCYAAVESVALKVPVISSGKGSLPEVVSGKHITMEQYSHEALLKALEKGLQGDWDETEIKKFEKTTLIEQYNLHYRSLLNGAFQVKH